MEASGLGRTFFVSRQSLGLRSRLEPQRTGTVTCQVFWQRLGMFCLVFSAWVVFGWLEALLLRGGAGCPAEP